SMTHTQTSFAVARAREKQSTCHTGVRLNSLICRHHQVLRRWQRSGLVPGARTTSRRRDRERDANAWRSALRLERKLYVVADRSIADLRVDRVRGRIREV